MAPARQGFTLIELLTVIGIIAVLVSMTIQAINPTKQLGVARDAQRHNDVKALLNAFWQYNIDYGAFQPSSVDGSALDSGCMLTATAKKLCKTTTPHGSNTGQCGDLGNECVWTRHLSGAYIVSVPEDPRDDESNAVETLRVDYTISDFGDNRLRIYAPNVEEEDSISVTR